MYFVILEGDSRLILGQYATEEEATAKADQTALNGQGNAIIAKAISVSVLEKQAARKPLEDAHG